MKQTDATKRAGIIKDFRKMLKWFSEHKQVPLPNSLTSFTIYSDGKEEFLRIAKQLGGFKKSTDENFFRIKKEFGEVSFEVVEWRTNVCTLKQVGTKKVQERVAVSYEMQEKEVPLYEWECPETILSNDKGE